MNAIPSVSGTQALTVADIAAQQPGATAVFRRHKIDFCCGGKIPLAEAAANRGVPLDQIEAELAALASPAQAFAVENLANGDLIDLIETRYHATHRRELPELARLARRVEAVHRDKADTPHGLAELLESLLADMASHMAKEEAILFPMMRQGGNAMIAHPIAVMRHEHDDHGVNLRAIAELTDNATPPDGACNTWRALYAGIRKLTDDLMEHIHLENNVLFPRFGA